MLKDWKKEVVSKDRIFYDNINEDIEVDEYTIDVMKQGKNNYVVNVLYNGDTREHEQFKSMKAALKYAKDYMRKN